MAPARDRIVDLRRRERLSLQQLLQEDVDRLATFGVSIEDRLYPPSQLLSTSSRGNGGYTPA
jgi:hypothetical protein